MIPDFRTGLGVDVHRFAPGRKLIICGVEIPHEQGLLGHSDADVALHALADALLGAAAMRDIGYHFPDTSAEWEGADSRMLLRRVMELLRSNGFAVANADITIIAQAPKIMPYIEQMRANIAADLQTDLDRVSVKATTTEHLGFNGRKEGITAIATTLVYKKQ